MPDLKLLSRLPLAAALLVLATSLAPGQRLGAQPLPAPASALPALGEGVELPLATERKLGDRIAASIYRDEAYLDDPVLGDYLQAVWLPLMAAARARGPGGGGDHLSGTAVTDGL